MKNLKKQKDLDFINIKTANEEKSVKENNQEKCFTTIWGI